MPNSASQRRQQRLKIEEICRTLVKSGIVALDQQADVLGLSRSTTWTMIRGIHKSSGLSATTLNRMLASGRLPLRVRLKILEYIAEKMSGAYGDRKHCLRAFANRISPVHMDAALARGAKPDAAHEGMKVHKTIGQVRAVNTTWRTVNGSSRDRGYPAFSIAAASRPSKVEPGSDHGSSQS